jgi:hypothetical protein
VLAVVMPGLSEAAALAAGAAAVSPASAREPMQNEA